MAISMYREIVDWIYVLITALIPGFLATWLGVGGCFLRIPMIMYFFNIPIKTAYCINQAVIALTTIPGVIVHYKNKYVYNKGLLVATLGACIGVSLGAYVVARYISRLVLRIIFGFACTLIGVYILHKTVKFRRKLKKVVSLREVVMLDYGPKLFILMFLAGFATGICGFGGGIYYVPILITLGYPTHIAVGTSSAQMIFTAGLGSSVLTIHGNMNWKLFLAIGIPTTVASWFGAKLAHKSPPYMLRLVYAILIVIVGLYVAIESLLHIF